MHLAEDIVVEVVAARRHRPLLAQPARPGRAAAATSSTRLDDRDLFPFAEQAAVADRLMELARANQPLIAQQIAHGRRS